MNKKKSITNQNSRLFFLSNWMATELQLSGLKKVRMGGQ